MRYYRKEQPQSGFTIIELMIATTVLSVILLWVTSMMIGIGALFYRGVSQARIQDAVRSTADEVSQQLELSGVLPSAGQDTTLPVAVNVYCMGNIRYSYVLNTAASSALPHIFWRDNTNGACDPKKSADLTNSDPNHADAGTNGGDLLPAYSLLTAFCIGALQADNSSCNPDFISPYTIHIGMAYGDASSGGVLNLAGINSTCKGGAGDQFCATSSLTTSVASRLEYNK